MKNLVCKTIFSNEMTAQTFLKLGKLMQNYNILCNFFESE